MAELGSAYVNIIPKAPGIERNLKQLLNDNMPDTSKQGQKLGSGLVSGIKKVVAGAAIGKVIKDAFTSGAEYEQLAGGVEKIFAGMDTSKIFKDANKAFKNLNLSANDYLAAINDVGASFAATMGAEAGYETAKKGLQAISDYASGTGKSVDLLSQKFTLISRATSSYMTIADQFSGILPATSTDFLAQAKAAGLLADSYTELSQVPIAEYQQAVASMLELGVEKLNLSGITAAETATTLTGSLRAVKASWENTMAALVTGEGLNEALANLSTSVGSLTGNVLTALENIIPQIPTLVGGIASAIIDHAPDIASSAVSLLAELGGGLISNLPVALESIPDIFTGISEALLNEDWESPGAELIAGIGAGISGAIGLLFDVVDAAAQAVVSALDGWLGQAAAKLASLFAMAADGAATAQGSMGVSGGNNVTIPRSRSVGGYATGLNYVPYDEFPALLHQGEMVVPRRLASQMRAAGISKDSQSLPWGVVAAAAPTPTNVTIEFRGSLAQLARVLQPYIVQEGQRRGEALVT